MAERASRSQWTRVAFGDVVRLSRERSAHPEEDGFERYVGLEHLEPGDLKIRRWGDVSEGTTFTSVFRSGQVLFGKRRAYQRKVAVADFDGVCSGDIYVLEPSSEALMSELLPFICQTDGFFEHAVGTSAGSLSPRTNWTSLASFEFDLPPVEEQRRVVLALQASEQVKQRIRTASQALEYVSTSLLQSSLDWRGGTRPLGDVLLSTDYGSSTLASSDSDGVPILRIPNILRGELDLRDMKWVRLSKSSVAKYRLREGDILVVRTNGNPEYVGRCLVVPAMPEATIFASYLIRLTVDPSVVRPQYVASVLNSSHARRLLRSSVRSSAGNFNVNVAGIRGVPMPVPSLSEQDSLLARLAVLRDSLHHFCERGRHVSDVCRLVLGRIEA